MIAPLRACLATLFILVQPDAAWAHSSLPGIEGFYTGLWHPFTLPAQTLTLFAWSLASSRNLATFNGSFAGFVAASIVAAVVGIGAPITFDPTLLLLIAAIIASGIVAGGLNLSSMAAHAGGIVAGALTGIASVPDPGPATAMHITAAGTLTGSAVIFVYVTMGAHWLQTALKWSWFPIALRIAGSWTAAISVLLLALERDVIRLSRFLLSESDWLGFKVQAGMGAGMDGQTIFDGSSRAGCSGG